MNSINNTTKRTPQGERRTRQSWARFFVLAAFCTLAALSVKCNLGLFECPGSTGTGGVRSEAAPINKLAAVINPPSSPAAYIVRDFLMETEL